MLPEEEVSTWLCAHDGLFKQWGVCFCGLHGLPLKWAQERGANAGAIVGKVSYGFPSPAPTNAHQFLWPASSFLLIWKSTIKDSHCSAQNDGRNVPPIIISEKRL